MLWYRSPSMAPPISMKMSTLPSRSQSPQATPCPFCRCPVPEEAVISAKRLPATFLNMRLGTSVARCRVAGAQVDVEEAVVVEVAEVAAHRGEDQVEPGLLGHVSKPLAPTLR